MTEAASRLRAMRVNPRDNMEASEVQEIREFCNLLITDYNSHTFAKVNGLDFVVTRYEKATFICARDPSIAGSDSIRAFIKVMAKESPGLCAFVNGIWVDPSLRGKGFAFLLYNAASGLMGSLQSDPDSIGVGALAVWRKLSATMPVQLYLKRGSMYFEAPFQWGPNNIPIVDGQPLSKLRTKFVLYTSGRE